jgi:hypothetical protein
MAIFRFLVPSWAKPLSRSETKRLLDLVEDIVDAEVDGDDGVVRSEDEEKDLRPLVELCRAAHPADWRGVVETFFSFDDSSPDVVISSLAAWLDKISAFRRDQTGQWGAATFDIARLSFRCQSCSEISPSLTFESVPESKAYSLAELREEVTADLLSVSGGDRSACLACAHLGADVIMERYTFHTLAACDIVTRAVRANGTISEVIQLLEHADGARRAIESWSTADESGLRFDRGVRLAAVKAERESLSKQGRSLPVPSWQRSKQP